MNMKRVAAVSILLLVVGCSGGNGATGSGGASGQANDSAGSDGNGAAGLSAQGGASTNDDGGATGAGGPGAGGAPITSGGTAGAMAGVGGASGAGGALGMSGASGSGGARAATGRDYYCDPVNGLPTNPGTEQSPWRRLEEVFSANKTFADGDIVHLRTGNHGSPVIKGGIASGNRSIIADSGQAPVLKTLEFASGATRWTVDGVLVSPQEADGSVTTATLVQFDTGATNNVFQDSQLRYAPDAIASTWDNTAWVNSSGTAIYVLGSDNQILNNQIRNTHVGIMVERTSVNGAGGTGSVVRGNTINHFWEDAFRGKVSNCTFEYNSAINSYAVVPPGTESDPPHRDMFQSYRGDSGFVSIDNLVLRGNVFIARQGTRYTKVPFEYDGHYTIQGLSAFDGPYSGWTIEDNVIMVEVGLAMGLYGMNDSTIVNNTVVPDTFGTDSEIRLTYRKGGTPSNGNIVRNNLVHTLNIDPAAATNTTQSNNLTIATGAYATYFLNYPAGDVHLKSGSPAIDAGTSSNAPAIDADQAARTVPYDVGAYEFVAAAP